MQRATTRYSRELRPCAGPSFVTASGDDDGARSTARRPSFPASRPVRHRGRGHAIDDDGSGRRLGDGNRLAAERGRLCQRYADSRLAAARGCDQCVESRFDLAAQLARCGGGSGFRQSHRDQRQFRDGLRRDELCHPALGRVSRPHQSAVRGERQGNGGILQSGALQPRRELELRGRNARHYRAGSNRPPTSGGGWGKGLQCRPRRYDLLGGAARPERL